MSERFSCEESAIFFANLAQITQVLIFCVEFWELSHLTCDVSPAEKKINAVTISKCTKLEISNVLNGTTPKIQHKK